MELSCELNILTELLKPIELNKFISNFDKM